MKKTLGEKIVKLSRNAEVCLVFFFVVVLIFETKSKVTQIYYQQCCLEMTLNSWSTHLDFLKGEIAAVCYHLKFLHAVGDWIQGQLHFKPTYLFAFKLDIIAHLVNIQMSVLKELLGESPSTSNLGQQRMRVRRERRYL